MLKAIIIDDEVRAQRVLKNLIENFCEGVEIVASCSSLIEGVLKINELDPDIVFCDIEMPQHTGLELLNFFKEVTFELIFATGYSEYAIQAFEMSAIDYLLKPIQLEKLEAAIEKVKSKKDVDSMRARLETLQQNFHGETITKVALPVMEGLLFVEVSKISLLEADGSYTNVWFTDGTKMLISKKLKFFEDMLQNNKQFYRIHRSSIINLDKVAQYAKKDGLITMENKKITKVAREKKSDFEAKVASIRI
jgi:two-component system LytT family response regulator